MAEVHLDVSYVGLEGVKNDVRSVRDALEPPSITESLGDGADVFLAGARARAPQLSGRLALSIDKHQDGPLAWEIRPDTVYAGVQEYGATITPVRAPKLVFYDDGVFHREDIVHIPAQPYMRPTFTEDQAAAAEAVKTSILSKIG